MKPVDTKKTSFALYCQRLVASKSVAVWFRTKRILSGLAAIALCFFLSGAPCLAQAVPPPQPILPEVSQPIGPTTPQELGAFLDQFFAEQMEKLHGAAFALVKDGKTFVTKGYGFADLEKQIPVTPEKTLFRVGSVSKLFTATSVMQLAEQGRLNIDDDVNKHLERFQVGNTYSQPITFANLLTHTDGFDFGWGIGAFARSKAEMMPLGDYIAKRLPPRLLPPGEVFLYSDVGMTLAGYLVEVISKTPFAQYIDAHILRQLNMHRSSFLQPLPSQLVSDLATGYNYESGSYQRQPFAYFKSIPAGAFSTTATDMANFMIAHLQNGRYGQTRILQENTAKEMHRQQFAHHPLMAGSAYGFYERFVNGQRALEHSGRMNGYNSLLFLLPEHNLGFFLACNNNGGKLLREFTRAFINRYYPSASEAQPLRSTTDTSLPRQGLAGIYRLNRYSHTTMEKLAVILGEAPEVELIANDDGTLTLSARPEEKWLAIEPLLFRADKTETYLTFREKQGVISYLFLGDSVLNALERLAWYEPIKFQVKVIAVCAVIFLLASLVALSSWLKQLISRTLTKQRKKPEVLAQGTAVVVSLLNIGFLIGMALTVLKTDFWEFLYGVPGAMRALLLLPPVSTGLTTGLVVLSVVSWFRRWGAVSDRLLYSVVSLAGIVFALVVLNK